MVDIIILDEQQIGGVNDDRIFINTDFTRTFQVLDFDAAIDGTKAKDVAGETYVLDIRKKDSDADPIHSAALTVVGTFNVDPAVSTQRLQWACAAADLTITKFSPKGGTFRYSVKRTDSGVETIVRWGDIVIDRATQKD